MSRYMYSVIIVLVLVVLLGIVIAEIRMPEIVREGFCYWLLSKTICF